MSVEQEWMEVMEDVVLPLDDVSDVEHRSDRRN